jgi:glycosyltransferase involved in cell wall biosynthesis
VEELTPVTVGLVSPLPPQLGGVATVARWLLDHEATIGCRYVTFDLERPGNEAGGRFRLRTVGNQLVLLARFLSWARRAPLTVHCMTSPTLTGLLRDVFYLGVLACFGRRTIAHVHVVRPSARWWRLAIRLLGRLATKVVVLGTAAQSALDQLGVPSRVVPNAIPFPPTTRCAHDEARDSGPLRLLFVGTFGKRKGCHELVGAMDILRTAGLDCCLDIVGREEYAGEEQRLRNDIETYGIGAAVSFLGQRAPEGLSCLYTARDVFCLPSHLEGLPLALIEAMACGLPVVATPVGCVGDLVIHNETGLLAQVGDATSLAQEIARLARDPLLRQRLGRNAARHVASHMAPDIVAAAWRENYSRLA